MKKVFLMIAVLMLGGCVSTGAYHAAGTLIGVEAGIPEAGSLAIGYRNFEITVISDQSSADISTATRAGADGLDTGKRTIINGSDDITVNESREHDGSTDTTG